MKCVEEGRTFKSVTRSAACSSVSPEMSSTIRPIFGSLEGGGELGADDDAASVTKHLDRLASGAKLKVLGELEFGI